MAVGKTNAVMGQVVLLTEDVAGLVIVGGLIASCNETRSGLNSANPVRSTSRRRGQSARTPKRFNVATRTRSPAMPPLVFVIAR